MKQNATVSGSQRFQIRRIRIILPEQDQNYFSLEPVPNLVGWVKSINKIGTGMKGEKGDGQPLQSHAPQYSIGRLSTIYQFFSMRLQRLLFIMFVPVPVPVLRVIPFPYGYVSTHHTISKRIRNWDFHLFYGHIILLIELQENETLQTTTNFRIQVRSVQVMHSRV